MRTDGGGLLRATLLPLRWLLLLLKRCTHVAAAILSSKDDIFMSEVEQQRAAKDFSGVKKICKLSNCEVILNLVHYMTY